MTDAAADPYALDVFTPHVGKLFTILHPQVPADFKLRLVSAVDPARGSWPKKFRRPVQLTFRGPPDPILLEGDYDIETDGFPPMRLHIAPMQVYDREENGQGYQVAIN
jgi:hypothetical protein